MSKESGSGGLHIHVSVKNVKSWSTSVARIASRRFLEFVDEGILSEVEFSCCVVMYKSFDLTEMRWIYCSDLGRVCQYATK